MFNNNVVNNALGFERHFCFQNSPSSNNIFASKLGQNNPTYHISHCDHIGDVTITSSDELTLFRGLKSGP